MIDILVYLFKNYHDFSSHPKPEALARKLNANGFEGGDISEALDWLAGLKAARAPEFASGNHTQRVYIGEEQQKLGAECLGFILFLETAGVISPAIRELVIERGMLLKDFPVPLAKFKVIVLMVLWSQNEDLDSLIVEELLYEADTELLH